MAPSRLCVAETKSNAGAQSRTFLSTLPCETRGTFLTNIRRQPWFFCPPSIYRVPAWRSGNGVRRITKVTLRRSRLVLRQITVRGHVTSQLSFLSSAGWQTKKQWQCSLPGKITVGLASHWLGGISIGGFNSLRKICSCTSIATSTIVSEMCFEDRIFEVKTMTNKICPRGVHEFKTSHQLL